jgi:1,4-dihydroxy-2-naphthoate octaprenyltransferase
MIKADSTSPVPAQTSRWTYWIKTARPFTLTATVSPVLVGTAVAANSGHLNLLIFGATMLSCLFLQIGANYFNEFFDYQYGLDSAESLGATTVIFQGKLTAHQVFLGGVASFVMATLFGIYLIATIGVSIILFGLAAMAIAYFYSSKPFKFASRGLGDPLVFLAMGVLMTWGSYYVQIPRWSWSAVAASIPVGLLVTAILNMNNLRDAPDDQAVHKMTLPVRFGQRFGQLYHTALVTGAYVSVSILALVGLLPLFTLAVWITFPLAYKNIRAVLGAGDRSVFVSGIRQTSRLHLVFGVALALTITFATVTGVTR